MFVTGCRLFATIKIFLVLIKVKLPIDFYKLYDLACDFLPID